MANDQKLTDAQQALIASLLARLDRTQFWLEHGVPVAGEWEGDAITARQSGDGYGGLPIREGEPIQRFRASLWLVARIGGDGVYSELRSLAVGQGTHWASVAGLQQVLDTCAPLAAAWDASTAERLAAIQAVEAVGAAQRPAQPTRPAGIDAETWAALPAYKRRRLLQEQRAAQE